MRRIQDQQPCLRTDPRRELGRIEREAARLAQWQRHRHRAVGDDLRLVDREARHREDHLVARAVVGDRGDRVADEWLRAGADDDLVGADLDAAQRAHRCRGGRTQFVDAGRRRIAMAAGADCSDGRVLHVHRRRKVGLADAEGDDVRAAADQAIHLRQHDERIFGAEGFGALTQSHAVTRPLLMTLARGAGDYALRRTESTHHRAHVRASAAVESTQASRSAEPIASRASGSSVQASTTRCAPTLQQRRDDGLDQMAGFDTAVAFHGVDAGLNCARVFVVRRHDPVVAGVEPVGVYPRGQRRRCRDDRDTRRRLRQFGSDRIGDVRERHCDAASELVVPMVRGVARHREHRRACREQSIPRLQQLRQRRCPAAQDRRRTRRQLRHRVDQHRHVIFITCRRCRSDQLVEKISRRERPHAADHAEHQARPSRGAKACT